MPTILTKGKYESLTQNNKWRKKATAKPQDHRLIGYCQKDLGNGAQKMIINKRNKNLDSQYQ